MDNILQEDATYLITENEENLFLESAQPVMENNYQFVTSSSGNAGILSFSERIR